MTGACTSSAATLRTAGRQTITVTDVSHPEITGSLAIDCSPGPASQLVMSLPAATTGGAVASLTVRALDVWGNAAVDYRGTIDFMSTDAQAVLPADYTFTAADRGGQVFIVTLKTAGSQSITAIDLAQPALTVTGSTTVTEAPHMVIDLGPTRSAGASGYSYDVWAVDASGDPATGYVGTIHFTSSDPQADLPADYAFTTADHGHAVVEGLTLKTAGTQWVRAVDVGNSLIQGTSTTLVTPGPTRSVRLSGLPSSIGAGMGASVWVTPLDGFGNIKTDYVGGDVHFASTDPQAVLPATYQFVAGDYGSHRFEVTLRTPGSRTLTVYAGSYDTTASTTVVPGQVSYPAAVRVTGGSLSWYLRDSNTSTPGTVTAFSYGASTDTPVFGDWDGDGTKTPGLVRVTGGSLTWYLRNSNSAGAPDLIFAFGAATDRPLVGDWDGNGTDTPGLLRANWWLLRNSNSAGGCGCRLLLGHRHRCALGG